MKLGDVLKLNKSSLIDIKDNQTYEISGVQNYGQGIVIRRKVLGSELNMKKYQSISKNQLMWCKVDTKNGAFGLTHDEHIGSLASTNMALADINTNRVNPEFLEVLFRQKAFADYITKYSSGTTNRKYLTPKQLFEKIELPNLNLVEQQEFIAKLKRIEKIDVESEIQIQKQLLTQLKQSILQEAIQGKLTADWRTHNPNTEPASELLKRIKAEKAQLIKDKKIKKEKALPPISADEIPFELPEGWVWTILDEVSLFKNGKAHEQFVDKNGAYILINSRFVSTNGKTKKYTGEQMMPMYKDEIAIVMSDVPNGRALSRCFMVDDDDKYSLNQRIGGIIALSGMYQEYLIKILDRNSHYLSFNDGKKQTNLKKIQIMTCPIPLPPLEEQKAIVEKVESLMEKCQALEQEIKSSEANAQMLMQAVLKEAFDGKQEVVEV